MQQTLTTIDDWLDRRVAAGRRDEPAAREEASPAPRRGGRVWLNGVELGGADPRFVHLSAAYD
jgi:hypothetical protein